MPMIQLWSVRAPACLRPSCMRPLLTQHRRATSMQAGPDNSPADEAAGRNDVQEALSDILNMEVRKTKVKEVRAGAPAVLLWNR